MSEPIRMNVANYAARLEGHGSLVVLGRALWPPPPFIPQSSPYMIGAGGKVCIDRYVASNASSTAEFFGSGEGGCYGLWVDYDKSLIHQASVLGHLTMYDQRFNVSAGAFGFSRRHPDGDKKWGGGLEVGVRYFFEPLLKTPATRFYVGGDVRPGYYWDDAEKKGMIFIQLSAAAGIQFAL